jgi:hypothetical protein
MKSNLFLLIWIISIIAIWADRYYLFNHNKRGADEDLLSWQSEKLIKEFNHFKDVLDSTLEDLKFNPDEKLKSNSLQSNV